MQTAKHIERSQLRQDKMEDLNTNYHGRRAVVAPTPLPLVEMGITNSLKPGQTVLMVIAATNRVIGQIREEADKANRCATRT